MPTPSTLLLLLALSQEATPELPALRDAGVRAASAEPAVAAPPVTRVRGADEVLRVLRKLDELAPTERQKALDSLRSEYGKVESNPVLPPEDVDLGRYLALAAADQARVTARHFVSDLLAADASGLLAHCGLPFFLEDRRVDRTEDLRQDWVRSLKSKRTDLLALHDLEILSPQEMEKRHGPPPRRLAAWGWKSPGVVLAVAHLSGHAVVLLLRPVGAAWQVVGYHD